MARSTRVRQYGSITVLYMEVEPSQVMRRITESCAFGVGASVAKLVDATPIDVPPPGLSRTAARLFVTGRQEATVDGCLACHRIGTEGNDGPGPPLNGLAERLSPAQIARALRYPAAPMPSYRRVPAQKFWALVAFLANLRRR